LKIILTNDDGITAPGLETAFHCLQGLSEIIIVAPENPQSGVGHRVTTRSPIRVDQVGENRFSVSGTPADCSRIALKKIAPDADWLIAGINPGANLGSDVYNSGTVAAAREAAILGCPAIAISQYIAKNQQVDWEITGHHAEPVLHMLMKKGINEGGYWNVNLPHPLDFNTDLEHTFCGLDIGPHKYDYRKEENHYIYEGTIHERPRDPDRDVAVCFGGKVSITRISLGTADS
jgi:5'-nucleotidase